MIDIDKIKPGDKVVYDGPGLLYGEIFTIDSPAWATYGSDTLLKVIDSHGLSALSPPLYFSVYTGAPPSTKSASRAPDSCTWDSPALIRVGCKCGYLTREREAARG